MFREAYKRSLLHKETHNGDQIAKPIACKALYQEIIAFFLKSPCSEPRELETARPQIATKASSKRQQNLFFFACRWQLE